MIPGFPYILSTYKNYGKSVYPSPGLEKLEDFTENVENLFYSFPSHLLIHLNSVVAGISTLIAHVVRFYIVNFIVYSFSCRVI